MTEGGTPGPESERNGNARSGTVQFRSEAPESAQPWVGIAANPGSGRGRGRRQVERLQAELERLGLSTRVAWSLEERSTLVAESAADPAGCRCLVAAGGDGTVAALVNEHPTVPITVLPAGTENLFARHFRLDRNPARLASIIAAGSVAQLDLGLTTTRRFTLMAGIGFDADVVARHHSTRVGRAGVARPTHRAAYVESVLRSSLEYRFPPLTLSITDPGAEETLVGATAFIFNLPRYALGLPFAPAARGDDGWLDLIVFRNAGPLQSLRYLWMVLRGIHLDRDGVEHRRVRRVVVTSAETVPVQLDGDPGGCVSPDGHPDGDWTVEVLPNAIEVLVPDGG
ncbi:Diacylglycerol kinase family enzyme [Singulisphaera sp. GP187]|uniref:diacylglycerol/lipid kinase family protein n=1 Tax=Singulisphaera sp. GP187 TaxID=1882752 RepID=UPI00092BE377|nr:diacylglycerol kinase family protein [Singulisphaera sp. GP187]SIO28521.1 Diacylglycerol kinase family enzyme [Singulisphaera sp. GP187]